LTEGEKSKIIAEYETELCSFPLPPLKGWEFFNPLKWIRWGADVATFNIRIGRNLLNKAANIVQGTIGSGNQRRGSDSELPDFIQKKLEKMTEEFRRQLENIEGLTESKKQEFLREYETQVNSFPMPPLRGWEFFNPLKWIQWSADVATYALRLSRNILDKAGNFVEGTIGSGNDRFRRDAKLPDFMEKQLEEMTEKFRKQLEEVEGLPKTKQEEYVEEYESQLRAFPIPPIRGLEILNPFKWIKWGADVATFSLRLTRNILDKAASFVQGTIGSGRERRAITDLPDFMQKKVDKMCEEFRKQLERVEGLTDGQKKQLQREYESDICSFPLPPLRGLEFFNPFKWVQWGADVATYGLRLSRNILDKAAKLVQGTIGSGNKGVEVDTSVLPEFMQKKLDKIVESFRETLEELGLPEEQQDELLQDLEEKLAEYPLPSLKGMDFLNPAKWINWAKEISKHAVESTKELLQRANEMAEEAIANA